MAEYAAAEAPRQPSRAAAMPSTTSETCGSNPRSSGRPADQAAAEHLVAVVEDDSLAGRHLLHGGTKAKAKTAASGVDDHSLVRQPVRAQLRAHRRPRR